MVEDGIDVGAFALLRHIVVTKTIAMLILGLGSFMLGLLPMKLTSSKWLRPNAEARSQTEGHTHTGHSYPGHSATDSSSVVSLMLCFGGGVLLFTTLLHLQPEVRDGVTQLQITGQLFNGHGTENLGDLIFCTGFFLVFIIDQIVHTVLDSWCVENEPGEEVLHQSMSLRRRAPASMPLASQPPTESPATSIVKELLNELSEERYTPLSQEVAPPAWPENEQQQVRRNGVDVEKQASRALKVGRPAGQSFRGLFAVLALSFHEVFEGLAIGLEERVDHTWYLFFAVATHKLIIVFCIGLELVWLETRRAILITYVATFAIVTPLGIAMGMLLVHFGNGSSMEGTPGLMAVVLQGLAAGTLLYVVFFEVLARHRQSGFSHLMSIVLGFSVMLVLQMITHHSHSHGIGNNYQYLDQEHTSHDDIFHEHGHHDHHGHKHDH